MEGFAVELSDWDSYKRGVALGLLYKVGKKVQSLSIITEWLMRDCGIILSNVGQFIFPYSGSLENCTGSLEVARVHLTWYRSTLKLYGSDHLDL